MRIVRHILNRHPIPIAVLILVGLGVTLWAATDYIENTVKPRRIAERRAKIEAEIAEADRAVARRRYAAAARRYRYVLNAYTDELAAAVRGDLWHRLGRAHRLAAERKEPRTHLAAAVEALERALELRPPGTDAQAHLASREELGRVRHARYAVTGEAAELEAAIAAFEAALAEVAPDDEWQARLHRLAGNALRDRYAAEPEAAPLEPALAHYRQALETDALGGATTERAELLVELATAHVLRARNLGRPREEAQRAVSALEPALEAVTRAEQPRTYGHIQKLLGDAYTLIAEDPPPRMSASRRYQHTYRYESRARIAYDKAEQVGISRAGALAPHKALN